MLKISEITPANSHVVLRLEGNIAGPWVAEARLACEQILDAGRTLHLVLADIEFMDAAGASLLCDLQSRGTQLVECSPFVEAQLKAMRVKPT